VAVQEAAGLVGAVHLEAAAAVAELLVQAEVVEHRPEIEQFGIVAEAAVAALQAAPPVDAAGVAVHEIAGALADQFSGLAGQLGVRDHHPGRRLSVDGHCFS
jgi:hypothetical protein